MLLAETPAAARMIPLSTSLASLMANRVEHCERTVTSSSDGRCDTTPSEAPYFRPSFAIRPIACLAGPKVCLSSAGNVAVRFFAKHVDFVSSRTPKRDLEREPGEHRHD